MKQVFLTIIWNAPYGAWTAAPLLFGQKLPAEALIDALSSFIIPITLFPEDPDAPAA